MAVIPAAAQKMQAAKTDDTAARETRVFGTLLGASEQPDAGKRVFLVGLELYGLQGAKVVELPPRGTVIVATIDGPLVAARTDNLGRFEFKALKPGRFSLGIASGSNKAVPPRAGDLTLLRSQDESRTFVFDVASGHEIGLGKVVPKDEGLPR